MNITFRSFALASLIFAVPLPGNADNFMVMPGDLAYGHAKLEATCDKCHIRFDKKAQSALCADCHKEVGKDIADKRGSHGRIDAGKQCSECHPDHKGRYALIVPLDKERYDHAKTDFPLNDAHADPKVTCESCHKTGKKYREAPVVCNECHKKGDKHKGMMGSDCERCHSEKNWKESAFNHSRTAYKLLGRHNTARCVLCHPDDKYKETPKLCNTCHGKNDLHKGGLGTRCEDCHIERGWKETLFDHERKSTYPLREKHGQVKCTSCHQTGKFKGTSRLCNTCHRKDDKHKGIFGSKCEECHNEKSWAETQFDHDTRSAYPLLPKHDRLKCAGCHKDDWVKGKLKTTCVSCHQKDDKHGAGAGFGAKCETCHTERDWKEIVFDHDRQTRKSLQGKHKLAKCAGCHKNGRLLGKMPVLCLDCHEKNDMHKGKFGPMCDTCHNERTWSETYFDHVDQTGYQLVGKHLGRKCVDCHKIRIYEDERFRKDCIYCHAKRDVHNGREGKKCETCHNEMSWKQIIKPGAK